MTVSLVDDIIYNNYESEEMMEMKRTFVISDIRGSVAEFDKILKEINLTKDDDLVMLGNTLGNRSIETIEKIIELNKKGYVIVTLLGNIEKIFLEAIEEFSDKKEIFKVITSLVKEKEIADYNFSCSQEDLLSNLIALNPILMEYYNTDKETQEKIKNELSSYLDVHATMGNYLLVNAQKGYDEVVKMKEANKSLNKIVYIYGKTPTELIPGEHGDDSIVRGDRMIGINCGCYLGNRLACLQLENEEVTYIEFDPLEQRL